MVNFRRLSKEIFFEKQGEREYMELSFLYLMGKGCGSKILGFNLFVLKAAQHLLFFFSLLYPPVSDS